MCGVFYSHFFVFNLNIDGFVALAFQDHGIIAGILEGVRDVAAHVCVHDGIALAPAGEQGYVHAPGTGDTRSRQRTYGKYALGVRSKRIGVERDFVPNDFVT